jgi:tRNA A-37 threonylcarbamoyl transferase component Bud32
VKCIALGVYVPTIYFIDHPNLRIYIEYIDGTTLKVRLKSCEDSNQEKYAQALGFILSHMHEGDIFHGDLTSNIYTMQYYTIHY